MSRVSKQIKNFKVNVFFYIITLVVYFYSRKIFLKYLGDEFVGLVGTLKSFLGFLNLAELGIGTAIGFFLYKPLFNKDYKLINNLFRLFGYLYKKVGLFVLIIAICLSFFFPIIFKEINIEMPIIYLAFYSILFSALIEYFYNYHLFVLQADQKHYIVNKYFQTANIIKVIIQIIIAYKTQNYYLWILMEILFISIYSYLLKKRTANEYPWLIFSNSANKTILKKFPDFVKKVKQISIHKISTVITNGTDEVLIFSFVNIESVALFGNYKLITSSFSALLNNALYGIGAGVGNLVAENNAKQINKIFWETVALNFFIAGFVFQVLILITDKFILLWLENEKYILSNSILIALLLIFFIKQIRKPIDNFIQAYGLYSDTWAPITQSLINLIVSIILAKFLGILGILIGTIISLSLIIFGWKSFYLFNSGFKQSVLRFWKGYLIHLIIFISSFFIIKFIVSLFHFDEIKNYFSFIYYSLIVVMITIIIYSLCLYLFSKGFRDVFQRFKNLFLKKIKKRTN